VLTTVLEQDARAGDQILDRARDEHFAGMSLGGDAGADVDGDPADLLVQELTLACMQPGSDLEPQLAEAVADRARTVDGPSRPVEAGEEAVACRVDLPPPEVAELSADGLVMPLQQLPPGEVAEPGRAGSGADDVGEEHRGEHAIRFLLPHLPFADLAQKTFQLREEAIRIACLGREVPPRQLDQLCSPDVLGQVATVPNVHDLDLGSLQNQGRDADQREHVTDVHVEGRAHVRGHGAGTRTEPNDTPEGSSVLLGDARGPSLQHLDMVVRITPATRHLLESPLPLGTCRKPREFRAPDEARRCVDEDQGRCSLRVGGREQHREWSAVTEA
jgi:hypothetical protein